MYVDARIGARKDASLRAQWTCNCEQAPFSQHPKLLQRWDLRFSEIDYLIRERREPQKFLYVTRIGGGCAFRELAKAQASTTMLVDNVPLT